MENSKMELHDLHHRLTQFELDCIVDRLDAIGISIVDLSLAQVGPFSHLTYLQKRKLIDGLTLLLDRVSFLQK